MGKFVFETSDCIRPGKFCSNGIRDKIQWCDHDTDCITSDGQQYKCCIDVRQSPYYCGTANQCYLPDDSKQDNHSDGNHFSTWLFGGLGGFLILVLIGAIGCYFQRKKQRRSSRNNVPDPTCSGGRRERRRNVSSDRPLGNREQNMLLAPYPITNNLLGSHGNIDYIPNVPPPPPYSFDEENVSPDCNMDAPPGYQLTQF